MTRAEDPVNGTLINATKTLTRCFYQERTPFDTSNEWLFYITILTVIINSLFSLSAACFNTVFLWTLAKTKPIQTSSNLFLGNLALSDLFVGALVQPLYVAYKSGELAQRYSCNIQIAFSFCAWTSVGISFITISAVSCERYFAIFMSFARPTVSTPRERNVLVICALIWGFSTLLVASRLFYLPNMAFHAIASLIIIASFVTTAVIYAKIYMLAKKHHRSIQTLNHQDIERERQIAKETKMTKTVGCVTGVFFLCFLPTLGIMVYYSINGYSILTKTVYSLTDTLVFMNSSFNPVVYYFRNRQIRRAALQIPLFSCARGKLSGKVAFIAKRPGKVTQAPVACCSVPECTVQKFQVTPGSLTTKTESLTPNNNQRKRRILPKPSVPRNLKSRRTHENQVETSASY